MDWEREQENALVAAGVHPVDARAAVRWVVSHLPGGSDPSLWMPSVSDFPAVDTGDDASQTDAIAHWMANMALQLRFRRLLTAIPVDETPDASGDDGIGAAVAYYYIVSRGLYATQGAVEIVKDTELRSVLSSLVDDGGARMMGVTRPFDAGVIYPSIWYYTTRTILRRLHMQAGMLATSAERFGSWAKMDAMLSSEYEYLHGMMEDMMAGSVSAEQAMARSVRYTHLAWSNFWDEWSDDFTENAPPGLVAIYRRILQPAEHCDDCIEYADMGWQYPGALPPPGVGSKCGQSCKCYMVRRYVTGDAANDIVSSGG